MFDTLAKLLPACVGRGRTVATPLSYHMRHAVFLNRKNERHGAWRMARRRNENDFGVAQCHGAAICQYQIIGSLDRLGGTQLFRVPSNLRHTNLGSVSFL